MSEKGRKSGPAAAGGSGASAEERRRRQAEQLRANLLKRKEQSRSRAGRAPESPASGKESARD